MNILSKMEFKKPSNKRKLEEDTDTCFNAKRKNSGTTESTGKKIKKYTSHTDQVVVQFDSSKFPSDHVTKNFLSTAYCTKMTAVCYTFAQKEF